MYIRTAETQRLAALNAPEDTVEKFEELLPYAVALECAEAWQKRFDTILPAANYTPAWTASAGGMHGQDGYGAVLAAVTDGSAGLAAAATAARYADARAASASDSGGASSDSSSDSGSSGGGSGGSSIGGW
jgi:uncharacterized membrane protein YgcG